MESLHVQWMDEPGPTDVLSFPMDELRPGTEEAPTPAGLLGDIVLCPQVAETQAQGAGHSTLDELILLTTHGLLHLLGFDHAEPEENGCHELMHSSPRAPADVMLREAVAITQRVRALPSMYSTQVARRESIRVVLLNQSPMRSRSNWPIKFVLK